MTSFVSFLSLLSFTHACNPRALHPPFCYALLHVHDLQGQVRECDLILYPQFLFHATTLTPNSALFPYMQSNWVGLLERLSFFFTVELRHTIVHRFLCVASWNWFFHWFDLRYLGSLIPYKPASSFLFRWRSRVFSLYNGSSWLTAAPWWEG